MSTMDPVLLQFKMQVGLMLAKMHSGSEEEKLKACQNLVQLSHDPKLRGPIIEIGSLCALSALLLEGSDVVKIFVTMIITELSIPQENKEKCLEALPGLIMMLKSTNPKNQNIAARAVSNISNTASTKTAVLEHGALAPLIALLIGEDDGAREGALVALTNISSCPEAKVAVVEGGVLTPLFALLSHSSEATKESSLSVLTCLVTAEATHEAMIMADSFPVLLEGVAAGSESFKERCAYLLSTLSYAAAGRHALVEAGAVHVFRSVLLKEHGSRLSKELSVALFANICLIKKAQVQLVNEGVVPLLMQFVQSGEADNADMKRRVGWVLQNVRHLMMRTPHPSLSTSETPNTLPPPPLSPPVGSPVLENEDTNIKSSEEGETDGVEGGAGLSAIQENVS